MSPAQTTIRSLRGEPRRELATSPRTSACELEYAAGAAGFDLRARVAAMYLDRRLDMVDWGHLRRISEYEGRVPMEPPPPDCIRVAFMDPAECQRFAAAIGVRRPTLWVARRTDWFTCWLDERFGRISFQEVAHRHVGADGRGLVKATGYEVTIPLRAMPGVLRHLEAGAKVGGAA